MKELSFEKMEELNGGGWSWSGCAGGAIGAGLTPVIATIWSRCGGWAKLIGLARL